MAGRECYHTGHVLRKSISIKKLKKTSSFICDVIGEKYLEKKQTIFSGRENVSRITLYNRPCRYFMYYFLAFSYEILHHETRRQRRKIEGRLLSQEAMEGLTKEKRQPFSPFERYSFSLAKFFSASVLYNVFPIMKCLYFHVPC